jgi:hypothetical protein
MKCILFVDMGIIYEKYLRLEEDEQLWFVQDKHYELSIAFKM